MAHLMVEVHHRLHLHIQPRVHQPQPFVHVLVHTGFAKTKASRRLAHGIARFNNVPGQHNAAGLDIFSHPLSLLSAQDMPGEGAFMPGPNFCKQTEICLKRGDFSIIL